MYPREYIELLADMPWLDRVLWTWLNCKACHTGNTFGGVRLGRGQLLVRISWLQDALSYEVGSVVKRPSERTIRRALERLAGRSMIDLRHVRKKIFITIRRYEIYQDPTNYARPPGRSGCDRRGGRRTSVSYTQECKNGKNGSNGNVKHSFSFQTFEEQARTQASEALERAGRKFIEQDSAQRGIDGQG